MRRTAWVWTILVACGSWQAPLAAQQEKAAPRVLYVGDDAEEHSGAPDRAKAFGAFLDARFAETRVRTHGSYADSDRKWADVVILDWHQGGGGLGARPRSPLGRRSDWNRPVVMIGSAGLNTAKSWDVFGGSG